MSYAYQVGTVYSFSVYAANVLGTDFQNVTVEAILNADIAQRLGLDIQALQALIYPYVPSMPTDPTQFNYIQVLTAAGNLTILGMPWIDETTITVVSGQTITAVIPNVTAADMSIVQAALSMQGYENIQLTLSNPTT